MPAALERKLKKEADDKGLSEERKNAYVYGVLRKTGWKPSREKKKEKKMNDTSETIKFAGLGEELPAAGRSLERLRNIIKNPGHPGIRIDVARGRVGAMGPRTRQSGLSKYWSTPGELKSYKMAKSAGYSGAVAPSKPSAYLGRGGPARGPLLYSASSKLVRLAQIDNQLDSIVRFAYDDDDDRQSSYLKPAVAAGAAGVGGVGAYLGHQAVQAGGGYGAQWGAAQKAFGRGLRGTQLTGVKAGPGRFLGQYAGKGVGALKDLLSKIPGVKLSSKERMIQLDEKILEPFGAEEKSKIAQEQFPAGLSPAAALQLPFPELMKLLKQRNILQQQFSKLGKLTELRSRVDGIIKQ